MGAMTSLIPDNDALIRLRDEQFINYTDCQASGRAFMCKSECTEAFQDVSFYKDQPNATLWSILNQTCFTTGDATFVHRQNRSVS